MRKRSTTKRPTDRQPLAPFADWYASHYCVTKKTAASLRRFLVREALADSLSEKALADLLDQVRCYQHRSTTPAPVMEGGRAIKRFQNVMLKDPTVDFIHFLGLSSLDGPLAERHSGGPQHADFVAAYTDLRLCWLTHSEIRWLAIEIEAAGGLARSWGHDGIPVYHRG